MRIYKTTLILILAIYLLSGCAGRAAHPVTVQQAGDSFKSCETLILEMQFIQDEINKRIPKTEKTAKNVVLGTVGTFAFFPALFFMDLSKAEEIEIDSLRQRYNYLLGLSLTKKCHQA